MKPDDAGAITDPSVPQPPSTDSTAESTALTLPGNKALMDKLKTELGGSILPLIAQHQVPTQTLDELIEQLEGDQKTEAELMRAVVTGTDSEGVVKGFPDNITSEQLNHVMSFATDAQLETVFSNANNANKMVELLGDDSTSSSKTAILKRLQSRPQLAALLMKQVPDQSSTAATTVEAQMEELADAGATTGAQKLNFFKQLGSVAQQHVMSQLQDDQVASCWECPSRGWFW